MKEKFSRRSALAKLTAGSAVVAVTARLSPPAIAQSPAEAPAPVKLKGRINHSACKWCYGKVPLDEFCRASKEMGLAGVDLLSPNDFETVKKHGLVRSMVSNPG